MKLIMDIPDHIYEMVINTGTFGCYRFDTRKAIKKGTPIPDNATNERMVGSWIKSRDSYGTNHFTCPFCEHDIATRYADNWDDNYCSNCGADLRGAE